MPTIAEYRAELAEKNERIEGIYTEGGGRGEDFDPAKITSLEGEPVEKLNAFTALTNEVSGLKTVISNMEQLQQREADTSEPVSADERQAAESGATTGATRRILGLGRADGLKMLGEQLEDAGGFKALLDAGSNGIETTGGLSAIFDTASAPPNLPTEPGYATLDRGISDLMSYLRITPTSQNAIKFRKERLNASQPAGINEGAAYGELTREMPETTVPVEKYGAFIPITDEEVADTPDVVSQLEVDLEDDLRIVVERQILDANGVAPNQVGIARAPDVNAITREADEGRLAAMVRGIGTVASVGKTMVTAIVMHPADWWTIMALEDGDGRPMFDPQIPIRPNLKGVPVVQSFGLPEGTAVMGNFRRFHRLRPREDIRTYYAPRQSVAANVTVPNGTVSLVTVVRFASVIRRDEAFCRVENLQR